MSATWSSGGYERVAGLVRERTGLVFPEIRLRDVEASIRRAAARRGLADVDQLLDVLRDDENARETLVAELTIGETYFNRDPAQFELLRQRVLPELLRDRAPDRPLRVWSAGCASGEEPFSVAMLFDELGALSRADIVGTDIARPRLEEAQRGLYSKWSLRGVADIVIERYFRQVGRYWELTPRIRERVDFRYLNLAEDTFPSLSTGIWGMDVILCRNVLIYFDRDTVELVARRLLASLSENGWLILGASDPPLADIVDCDVVLTDAGLVYRRIGTNPQRDLRSAPVDVPVQAEPEQEQEESAPEPQPATPDEGVFERLAAAAREIAREQPVRPTHEEPAPEERIVAAYRRRDYTAVREIAAAAHAAGQLREDAAVAWLRTLANLGCLEDAARVATELLERRGPSAELLYLHGVILLQHGRADEAAALCRRALYLDRSLAVAHLTLAEAMRRQGGMDGARRALRNALTLLERMDREQEVPASDGETAGRLAEMTRTKLRLLEGSA